MSWIMKIIFGKSRSSAYEEIKKIAQSLPNYSDENGLTVCGAKTIREYIIYYRELESLMQSVERWKSSQIFLYEIEYKKLSDFLDFRERVIKEAGKYGIFLKSSSIGWDSVTMEDLPYPIVYYPGGYGAFFAFSEDIDKEICFCECEREAIENYVKLRKKSPLKNYSGSKTYPLGSDYFPKFIAEKSRENSENPLEMFPFKKNLCYRCNHKIPRLSYCHEMYSEGSKFKLIYGWYINQEYFKCGIDPYQEDNILMDKCSPEILDYITKYSLLKECLNNKPNNQDIQEELHMYNKKLRNLIENIARKSLRLKKIGET